MNSKKENKKDTWGFGLGKRFEENQKLKWDKTVKEVNARGGKLSLKKDETPGPAEYNL